MSKIYKDFGFQPDFTTVPKRGMIDEKIEPQLSEAANFISWPWPTPQRTFAYKFTVDGLAELRAFKLALDATAGRFETVNVPTWERNFRMAENAASGSNEIEIVESTAGYQADYLADDREDTPGRMVYFWAQGQTVAHITRIIRVKASATFGQEVLELEEALPFAVDYRSSWYGWALVARAIGDNVETNYTGQTSMATELEFRQLRTHIDQERVLTLDEVAAPTATSEAYTTATVTIAGTLGDYPATHTKAAYCEGPAIRTTVAHPYRTAWAAWLEPAGIRIEQTASTRWPYDTANGGLSTLATGAIDTGHISFCFDGAATEVLAYETIRQGAGEAFAVRHFDGGAQTRGPFAGFSPVLVFNGIVMVPPTSHAADSDVVVIYLKSGTSSLFARIDRDDFATETELCQLPVKLVRLLSVTRVTDTLKISAIDDGLRLITIVSDVYA